MGSGSSSCKAKAFSQDLRGKHFIVTGANTGLGYATTRELAKMGAKVTLACRSADKGQQAIDKIKAESLEKPVKEVRGKIQADPSILLLPTNQQHLRHLRRRQRHQQWSKEQVSKARIPTPANPQVSDNDLFHPMPHQVEIG